MLVDIARLDGRWDVVADLDAVANRAAAAAVAAGEFDHPNAELSLVFADDERISALNLAYRQKASATNVLSFPTGDEPEDGDSRERLLGDVVLAFETITREAREQGKTFENHLCHLIVHGVLHLLGYDHEDDPGAAEMEYLEISALAQIGVPNPYERNGRVNGAAR
ncbi:MAG: rRNA maturation RNase YbeY [Hyphomicrobiales bacterium]